MKYTILGLWRSSALIQGTLALSYSAAILWMACRQLEIPGVLIGILGTIIGYYFGTKERTKTD